MHLAAIRTGKVLLAGRRGAASSETRAALEREGLIICAVAHNAHAAVAAAVREEPDVCLLESELPEGAVHAAHEIWTRLPRASVIVLGEPAPKEDVFLALAAGAAGFLPADTEPDRIAAAVRGAAEGEAALPRTLVADLIAEFRRRGRREQVEATLAARGAHLTERERQLLELLADGLTSAEISERLGIAMPTVRSHAAAILRKLGASSRAEAIAIYNEALRGLNARMSLAAH